MPSRNTYHLTWVSLTLHEGYLIMVAPPDLELEVPRNISCKELTYWKNSDAGRDWGQEEKGTTEDEMAGWHH